jgi:hypothetical protein
MSFPSRADRTPPTAPIGRAVTVAAGSVPPVAAEVSRMVAATSAGEIAGRVVVAALLAVVTTRLSLRLLGVRRGWTAALTAGVAGWLVGGLLALALNDGDWDADGLVLQVLVISVRTTMAAAVGLDLCGAGTECVG